MLTTAQVVIEKALAFVLGLLVLVVAFRGGNMDRAMYAAALAGGVLLALVIALRVVNWRQRSPVSTAALYFWGALLLLVVDGLVFLLPLAPDTWLSQPGRRPYADLVALLRGADFGVDSLALSLDPASTKRALVALIPCLAIAVAAQYLSRRSLLQLLGVVAVVATVEAVVGLLQLGLRGALVLDYAGHQRASGTFVNKNHFATLLAMSIPLLVLRTTGQFTFFAPAGKANDIARALWGAALAFVAAALMASMSRAGVVAGVVAGSLALLLAWQRKQLSSRPVIVVGAFLALSAGVLVVYTGLGKVVTSMLGGAFSDGWSSRSQMAIHTWHGIVEMFPLGAGLGSYNIAFQRFQTEALAGYVEYAHNDYLQLLFETGVVGIAVLVLIGVAAWRSFFTARQGTYPGARVAPAFACLLGALAFAIHAGFDFPAHIPGLAICVTLLFAAAMNPASAQVGVRRVPSMDPPGTDAPQFVDPADLRPAPAATADIGDVR